jgi:hypothetical protein
MKKITLLLVFCLLSTILFCQKIRLNAGYNYNPVANGFNLGVSYQFNYNYISGIGLGVELYSPEYKPYLKASFEQSFIRRGNLKPTLRLDYLADFTFETQVLRPALGLKLILPIDATKERILTFMPFYARNIELKGEAPNGVNVWGIQLTYYHKN